MEIWGGIECTINRVGDKYMDQLEYAGHYDREGDLDLLAGLGIKKLRYPVLWERHQPEKDQTIDWTLTSERLTRLRDLKVEPIVGLVHHGSGPSYVNISDESFATGLAEYAGHVATAFPWIQYYTPVNEPLTTARFCGLYGIWYPHGLNARTFLRILMNECKATVLSMQAIRKVNPDARLVQTEDMGRTHSTPKLRYQADFENQRRWLSLDLLCGKVDETHPLYPYLLKNGITPEDISFFQENLCPPDVIGINHYLTSERYLDDRLHIYPEHTHGGNGRHQYADVEVIRVGCARPYGPYRILKEVWNRYKIPTAITEVHLHCTREEQMRWFNTVLKDARRLKKEGADIVAVTPWALLGSFGWNCLLRQECGDYEAGVFDVSSGVPRATALSTLILQASSGLRLKHPLLKQKGWWEREARILYHKTIPLGAAGKETPGPILLIIADSGAMAGTFSRLCELRNIPYQIVSREQLQLTSKSDLAALLPGREILGIVDAGEFLLSNQGAGSGKEADLNVIRKSSNLAALAKSCNVKMMTFSKDPLTEHHVMLQNPKILMIRTSLFSHEEYEATSNTSSRRVKWLTFTSTDIRELLNCALDLMQDDERGVWHLINPKQNYHPALTGTSDSIRAHRL